MAIDNNLRGYDIVRMNVVDVIASVQIKERATKLQSKSQMPVRFEISEKARTSMLKWMNDQLIVESEYSCSSRFCERLHISTRQYVRIVRA